MVAVGTEADMKKIRELEAGIDAEEALSPPKKKPHMEKARKGRKGLVKENRKKKNLRQRREERQRYHCCSSPIRASATPSQSTAPLQENTKTTSAALSQPTASLQKNTNATVPLQEITNTTSAAPSQPTAPLQNTTTSATSSEPVMIPKVSFYQMRRQDLFMKIMMQSMTKVSQMVIMKHM